MTFDEVINFYVSATGHRSKDRDQYSLQRLYPHFRGRRISDLRRIDLRDYIRSRQADGVKLATVRRELAFFSAAINYARVELEYDMPNPVRAMGLPEGEERVRWLTKAQARKLVRMAEREARRPHLSAFICLAIATGCRSGELLGLEWSRVDIEEKLLFLEPRHTKNAKRRTVPLNASALKALRILQAWNDDHAPGSPWVFSTRTKRRVRSVKKAFKTACESAVIDDFRIHDLRHTCASWLVMRGVSLYVVKELLGHSSITVTERYAHLAPDQTRAAVDLLDTI